MPDDERTIARTHREGELSSPTSTRTHTHRVVYNVDIALSTLVLFVVNVVIKDIRNGLEPVTCSKEQCTPVQTVPCQYCYNYGILTLERHGSWAIIS
jgi:hypothetical protein